ncbi:MAG: NAD-binding protein [Eubacteriaceae bacterium]|nr:NAD-binding protein [Eubacteriaceae bacterium]MDD4508225.1 NAD-binding protein [Eubacteriaceae bacterium]
MKQKIVIIGGRDNARFLAKSLLTQKYHVTAINKDYTCCTSLAEIDGLEVIHGDGTKPYVLEDACVDQCATAIALTHRDADNLIICELCKRQFHVQKTISLVKDPEKIEFFKAMGVDAAVCAVSTVTGIIEREALKNDIAALLPLGEGRVSVADIPVSADAAISGKSLSVITFPADTVVGCIIRNGKSVIPGGDSVILPGDRLIVITSNANSTNTIQALTGNTAMPKVI